MRQVGFNINSVIKIEVAGLTKTHWKWLPKKQKTWFFGLIKRNKWYDEGFYSYGCYQEDCMGYIWDVTPLTKEELISYGYIVEDKWPYPENSVVYNKAYVRVYLESKREVQKSFNTNEEAKDWAKYIMNSAKAPFEIINL